jgi:membrane protein
VEKNKFERNALTTSNSTPEHSAPTREDKKQASKKDTKFGLKDIFPVLKKTFKEWLALDPISQGATLAYFAIFSLPTLLVLVVAFAGFVWGPEAVTGQLSSQISSMMGPETAEQIENMVAEASIEEEKSIWATIIAIVVLILGATAVFVQLQKTLNLIWEVKPKTKGSFLSVIKIRLLSFGLILSMGFLLLISFVITTVISLVGNWMSAKIPEVAVVILQIANFIISFGLISVLFALMFKFLPDVKVKWKSVWTGGVITSLLFTIGKMAIGLFLAKFPPSSAYGAAGSIILIMLWLNYSSLILFFGAEFTHQYSLARGLEVLPSDHAETAKTDEKKKIKSEDKK